MSPQAIAIKLFFKLLKDLQTLILKHNKLVPSRPKGLSKNTQDLPPPPVRHFLFYNCF